MRAYPTKFLHHANCRPIDCRPLAAQGDAATVTAGCEVSGFGLSFTTDKRLTPGNLVELTILVLDEPQRFVTRVMECRKHAKSYVAKVSFATEEDAFRARMAEQLCHIDAYRQSVQESEGRQLKSEDAAEEWIRKFASRFPAI